MARGAVSKQIIIDEILKTFKGSFLNGKEIRIPLEEDGEEIQIKITLTAAKDNVPNPEIIEIEAGISGTIDKNVKIFKESDIKFSEDEKNKVNQLLQQLGIQ